MTQYRKCYILFVSELDTKLKKQKRRNEMEELMVKAIRQFKREHKGAEIRTCAVWECSGWHGKTVDALFHIEYVESAEGEYKEVDVRVSKEK